MREGIDGPSAEESELMEVAPGEVAGGRTVPGFVRVLDGLSVLIPGAPQWRWGQSERSAFLFGSFVTGLGVGLFTWGTRTGLALIGFAFLIHVISASDAIRQCSFPGFEKWVPTTSAFVGLAFVLYGPLLLAGSVIAWPVIGVGENPEGYLIDLTAYKGAIPDSGDMVWLGAHGGERRGRMAEVIARAGQNVEWTGRRLRVDGRRVDLSPFLTDQASSEMEFQVPEGQILVASRVSDSLISRSWECVPDFRAEGRAWAKLYPVWDRRLLP